MRWGKEKLLRERIFVFTEDHETSNIEYKASNSHQRQHQNFFWGIKKSQRPQGIPTKMRIVRIN